MKKVIYILLAIVAIAVYSCQKDNTAPTKKITPSLKSVSTTLKIRKDTTPPDPAFIKKAVRDTTPPDPLLK